MLLSSSQSPAAYRLKSEKHMIPHLQGLHHVTAFAGPAPENNTFFTDTLGLRRVKTTVNFDNPYVYHLYFGDKHGTPGTVMTHFPDRKWRQGQRGTGEVAVTAFTVPRGSLSEWEKRLPESTRTQVFGEAQLGFPGPEGTTTRLTMDAPVGVIDVMAAPDMPKSVEGAGSVHHIAFATPNDDTLVAIREAVIDAGLKPTEVRDRNYFHSFYFREPGGVLFEVATLDIGFDADEPVATLGDALKLPPQHEHLRSELVKTLEPIDGLDLS